MHEDRTLVENLCRRIVLDILLLRTLASGARREEIGAAIAVLKYRLPIAAILEKLTTHMERQ